MVQHERLTLRCTTGVGRITTTNSNRVLPSDVSAGRGGRCPVGEPLQGRRGGQHRYAPLPHAQGLDRRLLRRVVLLLDVFLLMVLLLLLLLEMVVVELMML